MQDQSNIHNMSIFTLFYKKEMAIKKAERERELDPNTGLFGV